MNQVFVKSARLPRLDRGMSLLFSLLALAALSLAGVALVRSVNTSAQVIGNLGFKQDATSAGGRATETAITLLRAPTTLASASLDADSPADGYYATSLELLDPTGRRSTSTTPLAGVDWDDDNCANVISASSCLQASPSVTANGNSTRFVISRLCQGTGPLSGTNICAKPAAASLSDAVQRGEVRVGTELRPSKLVTSPYYRIIVRTRGTRNTVSFTETIVHF
jgi:type IV pilus assembly protein PilX